MNTQNEQVKRYRIKTGYSVWYDRNTHGSYRSIEDGDIVVKSDGIFQKLGGSSCVKTIPRRFLIPID